VHKEYHRILEQTKEVQGQLDQIIATVDFNKLTDDQANKVTMLCAVQCILDRMFR
jgi:hypothetical protein